MSGSSLALANLRAVVILIVLVFHSVLSYLSFLPPASFRFDAPPYRWQAFAIVDGSRWLGFDIFCALQDVYLMSLMFFLSGLFVWPSLARKGSWTFVTDRALRLGVPFLLSVVLLMPVTLYATYLATADVPSIADYAAKYRALPFWPSGPQWFLWQLLVLAIVAGVLHRLLPRVGERLRALAGALAGQPGRAFALLCAAAAFAYVPLALVFGPWEWRQYGPFGLQLCRPLHYAVYFFAGAAVGAGNLDRGLLAPNGRLAGQWRLWAGAALVLFLTWMGLTALTMDGEVPFGLRLASDVAFVLSCASTTFATLATFARFAVGRSRILTSLAANAYGMYIVHYVFVVWLQFSLLPAALPAIVKATLVFVVSVSVSWALTSALQSNSASAWLVGGERRNDFAGASPRQRPAR